MPLVPVRVIVAPELEAVTPWIPLLALIALTNLPASVATVVVEAITSDVQLERSLNTTPFLTIITVYSLPTTGVGNVKVTTFAAPAAGEDFWTWSDLISTSGIIKGSASEPPPKAIPKLFVGAASNQALSLSSWKNQ